MNVARKIESVTPEEFEAMEKDERFNYELIDGIVMMSPRPTKEHQRIMRQILIATNNYLKNIDCEILPEIELNLADNIIIPDLSVICNDDNKNEAKHKNPPLIVIEIISPSSASRDHITKRHLYEQLGIKEYWIVSPEEKCITIIDFLNNQQEMYCEGQIKSFVLPEVQIDLVDIFA